MALSDSMFLFEIVVEDIKTFMRCKEFSIRSEFADVFSLDLRKPNDISGQNERKIIKSKRKLRYPVKLNPNSSKIKLQSGQSVLLANKIEWLIPHMTAHPLEVSLWSKKYPDKKLGGTRIPWSKIYKDYLIKLTKTAVVPPVIVNGKYNIINETFSKVIAAITLSVQLRHIQGNAIVATFSNTGETNDSIANSNKRCYIEKLNSNIGNNVSPIVLENLFQNKSVNKIVTERSDGTSGISLRSLKENLENKNTTFLKLVKSDIQINKHRPVSIPKFRSLSSTYVKDKLNPLHYIFGSSMGHFGNRVYCVSYFTIDSDASGKTDKPKESVKEIDQQKGRYQFKICDSRCLLKKEGTESCSHSVCSFDLPEESNHLINVTKCKQIECNDKNHRKVSSSPDDRTLLDLTSLNTKCCDYTQKIEEVVGGVTGKVKIGNDPCFCTCECSFGFTKKTTYCAVCGGYEIIGEEIIPTDNQDPFPCPIFHKLVDKTGSVQKDAATAKRQVVAKSVESEKDTKKPIKKKKDDRFKFYYGYKGIPPHIGHSKCALPCTGTLGNVPKTMGWLWTAENIPGLKFRPMWKPGAVNKHVLRLLRLAKNPDEAKTKKRRKDTGKKKRSLKRPLLTVQKRDGEYTVTMETMKTFTKPRAPNQHPYEDKPVVTYTVGRTEEENRDRQKKRQREQRRLERAQRQFIQSAFRDVCREICLKTYQQALGILPGAEDPECPCFTAQSDKVNVDVSCSCSEEKTSICSDTDLDEWLVEFTPPNAYFDPTYKGKKVVKSDMGSQYTYLDFRVKLLDRFGNPVPRFFKGPDGRQQCSDLGGFWDPEHKWLEINVDGYVAPDGRWAPNNFIGPGGEQVEATSGKFLTANGKWLVVGVDGYVDCAGKWRSHPKPRGGPQVKKHVTSGKKKVGVEDKKEQEREYKQSEATWSCFGDVSPKFLSKMGIIGHGHDKKLLLSTLRDMLTHGQDVRIPEPSTVYHLPKSKRARVAPTYGNLEDSYKCHHPLPSEKGVVAVDEYGNKTYFRFRDTKNKRPKERLAYLANEGITVSSFHLPCFHSFINSEILKRQRQKRIATELGIG